ncbi:DUF1801 domain-containing protein [Polluticaenibacter yanchengensis]|uniref:DUF1801 domain-containing protein n=1 Tax=Polluticaenibacter yanchengensis TaxID=3014562 RepID=A0ABT4UM04_9BACT|nr:DUF1801 domain-containing protein [Chitinophagaceae bacterium LY-5]
MPKNKTEFTDENVAAFIDALPDEKKKADSLVLIELMENISGEKAKMFGPTIVGFGEYYYKYDSGHEGTAPILGFSPRKAAFSLYVFTGLEMHMPLVEKLGKFTMGKACIYVKKLSDIDTAALQELMKTTIKFISDKYQRL